MVCYGTLMGPSQAARSLDGLDRRQIAWINLHHVTEDGLDQADTIVINGYNRLVLPKSWGSAKRASADGTKWDLYEHNLLSEYHIRYGGFRTPATSSRTPCLPIATARARRSSGLPSSWGSS